VLTSHSCVADAPTDFNRQDIFRLANAYVEQSRLIGVFTKCDLVPMADMVRRTFC
jgi:hypothetical protein